MESHGGNGGAHTILHFVLYFATKLTIISERCTESNQVKICGTAVKLYKMCPRSNLRVSCKKNLCSHLVQWIQSNMTVGDCGHITVHTVTRSSPSPVISFTESIPQDEHISQIKDDYSGDGHPNVHSTSRVLQNVHIPPRLMEDFLELARENTENDLETCGILGAFIERNTLYVTTLIIPKQDATSSSCQAMNEVEAFTIQNERSLFTVGWIHTHPSQSCFMSSVDLHTQYSYQTMVPEAFAIVMAPTDSSRSYGIFRLSEPGGMSVLKECQEQGFHTHDEPADGSPIYEHCSNVYKNSNLRFEIFDLR